MEPENIKIELLALWATLTGWFVFIPSAEGRGAAVVAAAVLLLLIAPTLLFLALIGAGALVLFRAAKRA